MPLTVPTPAPLILGQESAIVASGSALTAGRAYLSLVTVYAGVVIAQMRCQFTGAPGGNVDMGIYDSTGTNGAPNNLLGHTGAILSATGVFTQNLTANLALAPGKYWLAWLDTAADSIVSRGIAGSGQYPCMSTSASNLTVLPATIGTVNDASSLVALQALVSGGFS